jgi:SAM-dependent methyltransferase
MMAADLPPADLQNGFDRAAQRYDQEVGANPAMRWMRRVSVAALQGTFTPGQHVLELGCGTGDEALFLGRRGLRVLATDLSAEMVAIAGEKVRAAGLEGVIRTRQLAAREVGALVEEHGVGAFDGAYSSFGPLNGEPDLGEVGRGLAALIKSGGLLVAGVMNRFYLFEVAWYLLHGRPRTALRRWKGTAHARVSPALATTVPTWYYTPGALARAMAGFRVESCRALPLLLPPPYLPQLWQRHGRLLRRLERWEERWASRWPWNGLGDHFLMVLVRK